MVADTCIEAELEFLVDLVVEFEVYRETRVVVVWHQTAVVVVCAAERELGLVVTTVQAYVLLCREHIGTKHILLPVDGINALVDVEVVINAKHLLETLHCLVATEHCILVVAHHIIVCVHSLLAVSHGLGLHEAVVVDTCLARLAALGGDKDNTVGTTGTIDSGRRGILKHSDILDIICRDIVDIVCRETVDYVKRRVVASDRTATTYTDEHFCIGRTVGGSNTHTRHLTRESLTHVGNRHLSK